MPKLYKCASCGKLSMSSRMCPYCNSFDLVYTEPTQEEEAEFLSHQPLWLKQAYNRLKVQEANENEYKKTVPSADWYTEPIKELNQTSKGRKPHVWLFVCICLVIAFVIAYVSHSDQTRTHISESTEATTRSTGGHSGSSHGSNNGQHYTSGIYPPIDPSCVYWVPGGDVYHSTDKCTYISGKVGIQHGSIEEAETKGKTRPCSRCGGS